MADQPQAERAPPLGTVIADQYELKRFLGKGGMGAVYEAVTPDGQRVAVKVLIQVGSTEEAREFGERFSREAELTASLQSSHVVSVIDSGVDRRLGIPFMAMPLLVGCNLGQLVRRVGPLHPTVAVRIIRQSCTALAVAHDADIIHRDIKPGNLFLDQDPGGKVTVRLLDFGIAKCLATDVNLTKTGSALGTPAYISPEQVMETKNVDARTDVWGLGMTLYFALAGKPAFHRFRNPADLFVALLTTDAPLLQEAAPWIDPALATIVHGTLLRDREVRCPTVRALREALGPFAYGTDQLGANAIQPVPETMRQSTASQVDPPASWQAVAPRRSEPGGLPADQPDPLLGAQLAGRYTLLRCLGRGGMGAVYEAEEHEGGRFAIKVIEPSRAGSSRDGRHRFVREAKAMSRIHHPHVVQVIEADTDPEQELPFIVMEMLSGQDLHELLKRQGPLRPDVAARLFLQACRGLGAAHELGFVHRDIKPANLFLHHLPTGEVAVKLCDFGLVKRFLADGDEETTANLTRTGGVVGSPMYISPEQARSVPDLDPRTDIWSLGVTLYHSLVGQPPWQGRDSVGELILAICTEQVPHLQDQAPWVPAGLAAAVHRTLRRKPEDRFQSMDELAEALEPFVASSRQVSTADLSPVSERLREKVAPRADGPELVAARTASGVYHTPAQPSRRRQGGAMLLGGAAVLAVAAGAFAFYRWGPPPSLPSTAESLAPGPGSSPPAMSSAAPEAGPPPALDVAVEVRISPADAEVTVDGTPQKIADGVLRLTAKPGDSFEVIVEKGPDRLEQRVQISDAGEVSPSQIELPVQTKRPRRTVGQAPTRRPPSPKTSAPAAPTTTAAPAATVTGRSTW